MLLVCLTITKQKQQHGNITKIRNNTMFNQYTSTLTRLSHPELHHKIFEDSGILLHSPVFLDLLPLEHENCTLTGSGHEFLKLFYDVFEKVPLAVLDLVLRLFSQLVVNVTADRDAQLF